MSAIATARQTAFGILVKHPDCLRDDVSMNDLIEDIAAAICAGSQSGTERNASAMKELPGSHELTVNARRDGVRGLCPKGLAASGLSRQGAA